MIYLYHYYPNRTQKDIFYPFITTVLKYTDTSLSINYYLLQLTEMPYKPVT